MSIITDLTRMWLTRSAKPFLFQNEYDQQLPFSQCEGWDCMCISRFAGSCAASARIARSSMTGRPATAIWTG